MADRGISVDLRGDKRLRAAYARLNPGENQEIPSDTVKLSANRIARTARLVTIRRGARFSPALPDKLTSRNEGRGLVGSIQVDLSGLPASASVGSNLVYARVHEEGGSYAVPASRVGAHTRSVGGSLQKVRAYARGPYTAHFPRRPWLEPAIDLELVTLAEEAGTIWEDAAGPST